MNNIPKPDPPLHSSLFKKKQKRRVSELIQDTPL